MSLQQNNPAQAPASDEMKDMPFDDIPKSLSLGELVNALTVELGAQRDAGVRDVEKVRRLMASYDASGGEWRRFAFWDEQKNYTRNLIATDHSTFGLMLLCWNKNSGSPIHDHANSECWLRVVDGQAKEEQFALASDNEPLTEQLSAIHDAGAVCFINDDIGLHRISNPSGDNVLVTLHCYSPPYDSCNAFLDGTGHGVRCHIAYTSENGERVCYD